MRSPAEPSKPPAPVERPSADGEASGAPAGGPGRRLLEGVLRLAAMALIAWSIWAATRPAADRALVERASSEQLSERLVRWTGTVFPDTVRLLLDRAPPPAERAWLRALRGSGVALGWTDDGIPVAALEVFPAVEPAGGATVLAASAGALSLAVSDAVGVLDTLRTDAVGGTLRAPRVVGTVTATTGALTLSAAAHDSIAPRAVRVLGQAGWESRFVTTALEERGWTVEARFAVAPGIDVTQGAGGTLDTARHAAVVALDGSALRDVAAIRRFVGQGGGLVLGEEAAALPGFSDLTPGTAGPPIPAPAAEFAADEPRRALTLRALASLHDAAVPTERRDGRTAVAARRVGAGRVVASGYVDTWRWRMEGEGDAPAAHAAWWSALVASAAHRPAHPLAPPPTDPAPRAATWDALGPPTAAPTAAGAASIAARWPAPWILPAVVLLLLAEWASRRLRGAR
jgi:hypothetical protein